MIPDGVALEKFSEQFEAFTHYLNCRDDENSLFCEPCDVQPVDYIEREIEALEAIVPHRAANGVKGKNHTGIVFVA